MYCFGPFRFDPATGFLRRGSDDVPLAPRAQALLSYLLERPGEVVAKDEVLDAVWGEVHVTDTSLKEAIHVLRVALGDTAKSATYIETIPRRGYRFLATVRREPDAETAAKPFTGNGEPTSSAGWQVGRWVGGLAIALMLASWLVVQFRRPVSEAGAVRQRFEVRLPPGHGVTPGPPNLALSPDGRHLAYVAKADGQRRLFLRPMARLEPSPIAGSEGATAPFFSPDGRWIGFFTPAGLHRVPRAGGEVETLCEIRNGLAASWGEGGIVMSLLDARDNTGLWSVPASGGRPRVLTTRREGEAAHRWPEVLPGGRMVLFTVWRSSFADAETALLDLESGEWSVLFAGSHARHAAPGHLVFLRDDQLWAAPFDERRRVLTGEAAPIVGGVATTPVFGTAHFAIASMGSLVFVPRIQVPTPVLRRLGSGPEDAKVEVDVPGVVHAMRLAPDGRRLAITAQREGELDLWIADLERGSVHRRTFDGTSLGPVWSPDGRWLLVATAQAGNPRILRLNAESGDPGEPLWSGETPGIPTAWSPDGLRIAVSILSPDRGWDLWMLEPGAEAELWLTTPFNESRAAFSPNGRFVAYESDETGRKEVYVRPVVGADGRWTISVDGGSHPLWSADGRQIWFRRGAQIYATDVQLEPQVKFGVPVPRGRGSDSPGYNLAFGSDGAWILEPETQPESKLTFLVNWLAEG